MTTVDRGYKIGDVQIAVHAPAYAEPDYLGIFRNDGEAADFDLNVQLLHEVKAPALPCVHEEYQERHYAEGQTRAMTLINDPDEGILLKCLGDERGCDVEFSDLHPDYYAGHVITRAMQLPETMLGFGAVFLHASYILYNGRAILFTGDKQIGKSTQAAIWEKHMGAEIVNGDRALIRRVNGKWMAYGSPYCGSSKICKNKTAEIAAIVMLSKAGENRVEKAGARAALEALLSGVSYNTWDKAAVEKVLDLCSGIIADVPFYSLACLPDKSAAETLRNALGAIL